jgi:hypothetical protein
LQDLTPQSSHQKGLSDELALTGLGVWWVIALGLAGFAYMRSKKAAG